MRLLCFLVIFAFTLILNATAQDVEMGIGQNLDKTDGEADQPNEFEFASSGLNIRLRPNYLPMATTPGSYEGGAFLDLGNGAYIYFDGLYLGSRREFFIPPSSEDNAYAGLIPRSWLPPARSLDESYGHRLYNTLGSKEAGLIGGGRYLNMTMMEIALMYGLDPTIPRIGFAADPIYGQQRFNSLYDPGDFKYGAIRFRENQKDADN